MVIVNAGGPAAYDIGTISADHNSVGYSQESTHKGYAGQNVISSYSRAEDSAHSSVRVSNSHASNDALLEHHEIGYAAAPVIAKSYAAPALIKSPYIAHASYEYAAHTAPIIAKAAYAAPTLTYTAHPAPILAKATYAPPAIGYAAPAAPILAKAAYAAPAAYGYAAPAAYGYAASPLIAKTYAAPLVAKTAYTYAAPAAPVIAKTAYAIAPAAPLVTKATYAAPIAAPVLAKAAIAAPALAYASHAAPYSYETTAPVVHTSFTGFGTSYAW